MTRGQLIWMGLLVFAVVTSGVAVVHAKFMSRSLFVELQQVRAVRDTAELEWGRLQIELAAQGALGRVTEIAGKRLQMQIPSPEQIVVVR